VPETLSIAEMAANVERSRGHIVRQEAIIARLAEEGQDAMANEARRLLVTMHEHLAVEVEMLARMQWRTR
jgi:hypothetical protein